MTNVLVINASIAGGNSNSTVLTQRFVDSLSEQAELQVTVREVTEAIGHLSSDEMHAWQTPPAERTVDQRALAAVSDEIVAEVEAADVLVLGMPMYNFGVPSAFKAWIDRLARAGVTFKYTENGPVGLLANKQVYVLATRGGRYAGTPKDTQTPYLRDFFAFLGLQDVEFVYAEGLAMGEETRTAAMVAAEAEIDDKVATLAGIGARSAA